MISVIECCGVLRQHNPLTFVWVSWRGVMNVMPMHICRVWYSVWCLILWMGGEQPVAESVVAEWGGLELSTKFTGWSTKSSERVAMTVTFFGAGSYCSGPKNSISFAPLSRPRQVGVNGRTLWQALYNIPCDKAHTAFCSFETLSLREVSWLKRVAPSSKRFSCLLFVYRTHQVSITYV